MRRRLLALVLAAAGTVAAPASAEPPRFDRRCDGPVDTGCYHQFCGIVSCTTSDCVVFYDPSPGYNTGTCIGAARPNPDDPPDS